MSRQTSFLNAVLVGCAQLGPRTSHVPLVDDLIVAMDAEPDTDEGPMVIDLRGRKPILGAHRLP